MKDEFDKSIFNVKVRMYNGEDIKRAFEAGIAEGIAKGQREKHST
jgi:hypothetical protein